MSKEAALKYLEEKKILSMVSFMDAEKAVEIAAEIEWVSVNDRLPENKGWYNIYDSHGVNSGYFFPISQNWGMTEYPEKERIYPAFWAPLPPPPKTEKP